MLSLPNLLTMSRIVVIPVIFLSIYIKSPVWSMLSGVLFVIAAITDYFDGYFARKYKVVSKFGMLFDPIADKLLVAAALVIILVNGLVLPISYIPVVVILCREILVSGLREFLSIFQVSMPVTRLAKWKTGFQMTALSMILIGYMWGPIGEFLLWIAGVLTAITGYEYFKQAIDYIKAEEKKAVVKKEEKKAAPKQVEKKPSVAKKTMPKKKVAPKNKAAAKKKTAPKKG